MNRRLALIIVLALTVAGLAAAAFSGLFSAQPTEPNPTLTIQRVTIGNESFGSVFDLEYAQTPNERRTGLMHRKANENSHGMLFAVDGSSPHFTMENVHLPLDIIFVSSDLRVTSIAQAQALSSEPVLIPAGTRYVVEMPQGVSEYLKLKPGDRVTFNGPPLGASQS